MVIAMRHFILFLAAAVALAGCETMPPQPGDTPEYHAIAPPSPVPQAFNNGAIYQPAQSTALFEDYKARRVGDLLTVILMESTNASKSASTKVAKDNEIELKLPSVDIAGRPVSTSGYNLLGAKVKNDRQFDGAGNAAQSNRLRGEIAVTVAEVLSNGNLIVQGEKWLGINQGQEYVRLRGIVRPVDISANNTVLSTQVANAQVYYGGTGAVAESNAMGWLTRFFNHPIWPF